MNEKRVLIIMPAHNEAQNIRPVIEGIRQHVPEGDILVIDDDSTDQTGRIAAQAGAIVVALPCNLGYGGAVQTGFKYAVQHGYRVGVLMDADGQHVSADIPLLLDVLEKGEADLALGSRFLGRLEYSPSWVRRMGMALFRRLASQATGQRITDPTSGFQAMTRDVMRFFARDNYPSDFPDADTIITLHFARFRIKEVPVTMRDRLSGTSMHGSALKAIYYVTKMLLSIFIVWLRRRTNSQANRPDEERA